MQTVSILYRCLIAILLCFLNLTQRSHRWITQWIRRHRYTITVNIGVTRHHHLWTVKNPALDNLQLNKPTDVVALIVNEQIPEIDLCQVIANAILFFRRLNIQHLIIYDYQGYIKACDAAIMDYVQTYDKNSKRAREEGIHLRHDLGQSSLPLPTIHFQSLADCSQTLIRVAQDLCEQVQQGQCTSDSIQIETVDRCYTKLSGMSEINLAVIIGPVKSAMGLHPWLTRLTEFITIDSYKQLSTSDAFLQIVQRYNRIEQRLGR